MNLKYGKEQHLAIVRKLAKLLDSGFSVWKFKFGIDPLLGLIPGLGDVLSAILSLYIVYVAMLHKLPTLKIIHMIFNILADLAIGAVPVLGDILDFVIKPNIKNLAILEKEVG